MERKPQSSESARTQSDGWDTAPTVERARAAGIDALSDAHWRVVHALRALHQEFGVAPTIVQLQERAGLDAKAIDSLFGNPYVAWRIAGLPHPGEEAETYLRNQ